MAISPLGGPDRLRAAAATRANTAGGAGAAAAGKRQADSVSISEAARSLISARAAIARAPDVREDRVSALKAAVADGSYSVDSRKLAAELLKTSDS